VHNFETNLKNDDNFNPLEEIIKKEIKKNSNWISFSRFMELSLYYSDLGYYTSDKVKFGVDGDYITAPEISFFFAKTIFKFCNEVFQNEQIEVLEFGAGSGKFALDFFKEAEKVGAFVKSYTILELSKNLKNLQQKTLQQFNQVKWLETPPNSFSGIVFCNEVLDSIPVKVVKKQKQTWMERGVSFNNNNFVYSDRKCSHELIRQIPNPNHLPDGYITEVHPIHCSFIKLLSEIIKGKSLILLIDYGFPAYEYYNDSRSSGTLMCHQKHHSNSDPFFQVGMQDITSHVDFSIIAKTAFKNNLSVEAFMNQSSFLLEAGLSEILMNMNIQEVENWHYHSNAIQKLTSPSEMGELFKVLVLTKNFDLEKKFQKSNKKNRL